MEQDNPFSAYPPLGDDGQPIVPKAPYPLLDFNFANYYTSRDIDQLHQSAMSNEVVSSEALENHDHFVKMGDIQNCFLPAEAVHRSTRHASPSHSFNSSQHSHSSPAISSVIKTFKVDTGRVRHQPRSARADSRAVPAGYKRVMRCPICDILIKSPDFANVRNHMKIHRTPSQQEQANLNAWNAYDNKQQNDILARETMYLTPAEIAEWKPNVKTFTDGGTSWDGNWGMGKIERTLPRKLDDGTQPSKAERPKRS